MASTRGRQVVVPLTNKSGGAIIAGDVVIIDTSNDTAFTTTTTGQAEVTVGIAQESIASNATGRVLTAGYAALVNVPSSMTRGRYLETHTVAKQATGSATRRAGSFGQFLTAGTTPTAILWGQTDQTASGGASTMASGVTRVTAADITGLTSTTFADLTGCTVTITTGARRTLVTVSLVWIMTSTGAGVGSACFDLAVDGTRVGQTFGLYAADFSSSSSVPAMFSFLTDALTAASHTFKVQYRVTTGTMKVYASTSVTPMVISAVEQNT